MGYKIGDPERTKQYALRTVAKYSPNLNGELGTTKKNSSLFNYSLTLKLETCISRIEIKYIILQSFRISFTCSL